MNIRILIILLFLGLGLNIRAQKDITNESIEAQKSKLTELVKKYRLNTLHEYSERPIYYMQAENSNCHITVYIDNIPIFYNYSDEGNGTPLFLINSTILGSGEHTFSFEVSPANQEEYIATDAQANVRIYFYPDEHNVSSKEMKMIKELDLSGQIGKQKLKNYTASATFNASLPFDYSEKLAKARDLRQVPNLEDMVVKRYNEMRQYIINFDWVGYQTQALKFSLPVEDMNYLKKGDVLDLWTSTSESFDRKVYDRKVEPITDYEILVCGNGKLVRLQRKIDKEPVLRINYNKREVQVEETDAEGNICITFVDSDTGEPTPCTIQENIFLYMSEGSDRLERCY